MACRDFLKESSLFVTGVEVAPNFFASIKTQLRFQVDLVAAEPLVNDPINIDWEADGKLWVVDVHR